MWTTYREWDTIVIEGCEFEVTETYLSAKWNGSYPKVLAKILWIDSMNEFVMDTLGYNQFGWKILGYKGVEDRDLLIKALVDFKGVAPVKSSKLKEAEIKKYFEDDSNLEDLGTLTTNIEKLISNFNNIVKIAGNVVRKVSKKNKQLVKAIDSQNIKGINKFKGEFASILEHITAADEVLTSLNEIGEGVTPEATDFNAEDFINGKDS